MSEFQLLYIICEEISRRLMNERDCWSGWWRTLLCLCSDSVMFHRWTGEWISKTHQSWKSILFLFFSTFYLLFACWFLTNNRVFSKALFWHNKYRIFRVFHTNTHTCFFKYISNISLTIQLYIFFFFEY